MPVGELVIVPVSTAGWTKMMYDIVKKVVKPGEQFGANGRAVFAQSKKSFEHDSDRGLGRLQDTKALAASWV